MAEFTSPTWTMIGEMQNQLDELHAENALRLIQILYFEILVYKTRQHDTSDGSPCWGKGCFQFADGIEHSDVCLKARKATEPFWKH